MFDMPEGKIFVTTSATAIFAEALAFSNARGVLSPIAIASPDLPENAALHKP